MSAFIKHICKCDACGATRAVSDSMEVPWRWVEARFYYGTVAHACSSPPCLRWITEFSREHGLELIPAITNNEVRDEGFGCFLMIIAVIAASVGAIFTFQETRRAWQRDAVKRGFAEHDKNTGRWQWKETKAEQP